MLNLAEITDTEKAAVSGFLLGFVEAASKDLGMSPIDFWS